MWRRRTATTALHWAAQRDNLALADLLIKAGANVQREQSLQDDAAGARCHQRQRRG